MEKRSKAETEKFYRDPYWATRQANHPHTRSEGLTSMRTSSRDDRDALLGPMARGNEQTLPAPRTRRLVGVTPGTSARESARGRDQAAWR